MTEEATFRIGVETRIDRIDLTYSGMPNTDTFSLVHLIRSGSYGAYAYTLYFPANTKEINVENSFFEVVGVDPYYLKLRFLGRKKI